MNQQDRRWRYRGAQFARWLGPVGATAVVCTLFLPWVRSGSARRSSFATWRTADRLGVLYGPFLPFLAGFWVLVPALAGMLWIATLSGRRHIGLVLGLLIGGVVGCGALLVRQSQASADVGVDGALICSLVTLAGALLTGVGGREQQDERPVG